MAHDPIEITDRTSRKNGQGYLNTWNKHYEYFDFTILKKKKKYTETATKQTAFLKRYPCVSTYTVNIGRSAINCTKELNTKNYKTTSFVVFTLCIC